MILSRSLAAEARPTSCRRLATRVFVGRIDGGELSCGRRANVAPGWEASLGKVVSVFLEGGCGCGSLMCEGVAGRGTATLTGWWKRGGGEAAANLACFVSGVSRGTGWVCAPVARLLDNRGKRPVKHVRKAERIGISRGLGRGPSRRMFFAKRSPRNRRPVSPVVGNCCNFSIDNTFRDRRTSAEIR
jgi:hypothetical protein